MVGSNSTMISMLVRSKMRKREDQGKDDVEQPSVVQTNKKDTTIKKDTTTTTTIVTNGDDTIIQTANDIRNNGIVNAGATIPELTNGIIDDDHCKSEWHFPPVYRPNTPPSQYMLYNDQVNSFLFIKNFQFYFIFDTNIYFFFKMKRKKHF